MIHGIGVDIVQLARIRDALARYGDRFVQRIYSPAEVEMCEASDGDGRVLRYAVRFAAKEAAFKAFRDDLGDKLSWHDFEVKADNMGEPMLALSGRAADVGKQLGIKRIHLSLSNTNVSASAIVVAEK
ncbi:MAG: holo-ACP synthase [Verrucomicrobia bacterium]|nr:holo-ACP synthase [Verrucomicrobiota bacterium]